MEIIKSTWREPERNFALERELLERSEGDFLLMYINRPCVVVGRNQKPEAEVDVEWCAAREIPVVRRISGGGAVWHDEGNVNFAFVSDAGPGTEEAGTTGDRDDTLDGRPYEAMVATLAEMGVEAEVGPRGELTVGGKKISGTATCVRRGRRLFHGTLLFNADLERMVLALAGNREARGRKVASVPSPTANLAPMLTGRFEGGTEEFMDAMAAGIARHLA